MSETAPISDGGAQNDVPDDAMPERRNRRGRAAPGSTPHALKLAGEINALLSAPIAVLPIAATDPVRIFKVGLRPDIEKRLKPDATPKSLRTALQRYTFCSAYIRAMAAPGAMRHDIDGKPVEPINDVDRTYARSIMETRTKRWSQERAGQEAEGAISAKTAAQIAP